MPQITVKDLLEAGIHYGHRTSRWNPKMAPYIYGKRKLIHIVDIRKTIRGIILACKLIEKIVSQGKDVIFVGTKRQARKAIKEAAMRCNMHFVNERWIGGALTNFSVIRSRVERLRELESLQETGEIDSSSKKEGSALRRELEKIFRNLDGLRNMERLPGAMVVIDPRREKNAVAEANALGIPVICLADTDSDPDVADVLIPGNDDAMRAIQIVLSNLGDAVLAGLEKRSVITVAQPVPTAAPEVEAGRRDRRGKRPPRDTAEKAAVESDGSRRVSKPPRKAQGGRPPRRGSRPPRQAESPQPQEGNAAPAAGEQEGKKPEQQQNAG